ncbi:Rv3654c family TadE-like protein [Luteococcus sp.]|uniref:Rv3654c family TadE-like protein n=1 Tax=Luteococcus sp. TaxID=1969402 RepID=UPI0037361F19
MRRQVTGQVTRGHDERGAGTVVSAGLCLALCGLMLLGVWVVGWIGSVHRVRAAADLSALAGAQAGGGGKDACTAARQAARRNHAEVRDCRVVGHPDDLRVTVEVRTQLLPRLPGGAHWTQAQAHAGHLSEE